VETYPDFWIGNTQKGNSRDLSNYAEIRRVCIEEKTMIRVKQGDGNDKDESKISRELDNQQPNMDKQ
jgi:hypothetical protein